MQQLHHLLLGFFAVISTIFVLNKLIEHLETDINKKKDIIKLLNFILKLVNNYDNNYAKNKAIYKYLYVLNFEILKQTSKELHQAFIQSINI